MIGIKIDYLFNQNKIKKINLTKLFKAIESVFNHIYKNIFWTIIHKKILIFSIVGIIDHKKNNTIYTFLVEYNRKPYKRWQAGDDLPSNLVNEYLKNISNTDTSGTCNTTNVWILIKVWI